MAFDLRKFWHGIVVKLATYSSSLHDQEGAIWLEDDSGNRLKVYSNAAKREIITDSETQTLTNKTLTSPNINEAVALTSTSTELNQLDGVAVGGNTSGDILTTDDTQTLTNKTFDANGTGNSLTNIEVDNLAAGVLDTDLTSVSASDDTLPSAKATKTYIDDGDTTVQGNLNTHIADTTTHGTTGNIVGTSDAQTLTSKTIDADNNTISNLETDNLKSTAKSGSDTTLITGTAGTDGNFPSWNADGDIVDSSKAVPTGDVIGTTDAQTITNKTFDDEVTLKELSSTPTTPSSGYQAFYAKNDGKLYKLDDTGNEIEVGAGGAGSPTTLQFFTADKFNVADLTTGNNASFNGGGTITASSLTEPSTPLYTGAETSFRYDPDADGSNDYFGVELLSITGPEVDKAQKISINYKTENASDGDFRLAVAQYDNTDTIIGSIDYVDVSASTTVKQLQHSFFLKDNVSYIRYGFQNTSTTTTIAMNFDKFVVDSALGNTTLYNFKDWEDYTPTGTWTTNTTYTGRYQVDGPNVKVFVEINLSGAPDNTTLYVDLPFALDSSKYTNGLTSRFDIGKVIVTDNGIRSTVGTVLTDTTSRVLINYLKDTSTEEQPFPITGTAPHTWGNGDYLYIEMEYPVEGWQATTDAVVTETEFNGHFVYYDGYTSKNASNQVKFKTEKKDNDAGLIEVDNTGTFTKFTALKKVRVVVNAGGGGTSADSNMYARVYNSAGSTIYQNRMTNQTAFSNSVGINVILEPNEYIAITSDFDLSDNVSTSVALTAIPAVQSANIITPKYEKSYNLTVTGTNWTNTDTPTGTVVKKYNNSTGDYEYWLRDVQIYGNLSVAASSLTLSVAGATFANTYSSGHGWTDGSTQTDYVLSIGGTDDIQINLAASYSGNIAIGGSYKLASKPSEANFPGLD